MTPDIVEDFCQMLKDCMDKADAVDPNVPQFLELIIPMESVKELYEALRPTRH